MFMISYKKIFLPILLSPAMLLAAPTAPTNLKLTPLSASSVKVSWHSNAYDNNGYKIFRDGTLISRIKDPHTQTFIDTGLQANTQYTYTVKATDDGTLQTFQTRVADGDDDIEEHTDGRITVGSSDLELTQERDQQLIGIRFTNIDIPKDATITSAYIQFQTDEESSGNALLNIQAEDSANALPFIASSHHLSNKSKTALSISWSPANWNIVGEHSTRQRTSDIKSLVQLLINKPNWQQNNAISFIISGTGKRVAESFNGDASAAPLLHIQYTTGKSTIPPQKDTTPPIMILNGASSLTLTVGDVYTELGATATDNVDGDISAAISTSGSVDTSTAGTYTLTYRVHDQAGNTTSKRRTIKVNDAVVIPNNSGVSINEVLVANTITNYDSRYKDFSSWIELYNNENHSINIGGYYLSDDISQPQKWKIPSGTTISAHSYLLIWADGHNSGLHTNFKLKTGGESVVFTNSNKNIIENIAYPEQKEDISFQMIDGELFYMIPSPKRINGHHYPELTRSKKPKFSLDSGFYNGVQTVELTQKNSGDIFYTTDGSTPTKKSKRYTSPLKISKTTVIRARGFEAGKFLSGIKTKTFFINEDISLPVMSLSIDDQYLHSSSIGLYPNYKENWMRAGNIEYLKNGESQFNENIGVRLFGNKSREKPQKSLAIYAKDKYGPKSIDYALFPDKQYIKKVKSFILRNSGNDWEYSHIRDGLFHSLVKDNMDIDYMSYQPVVIFVNGQYNGIINLREKVNEDYLEANHDVDADNVDLLSTNRIDVLSGDASDYKNLLNFVSTHSLTNKSNYEYVKSKVDLVELINYEITEIYIGNSDWPGSNNKYWRERTAEGKWRWILHDTDFGFAYLDRDPVTKNNFDNATRTDRKITTIFRKLLENSEFRNMFTTRFTTHLNTTFTDTEVNAKIRAIKDQIEPEMSRHIAYWKKDISWISMNGWKRHISNLYDYQSERNAIVRQQMKDKFSLSGSRNLEVSEATNGKILVDGVALKNDYNGNYFNNAKVTLTALPKEGYRFVKWSNGQTAKTITITLSRDLFLHAEFELEDAVVLPKVVINEFNYKSAEDFAVGDWIELYNNDSFSVDISGWQIKDDKDSSSFIIPNNTILEPNSYIILSESVTDFKTFFPDVPVVGNFTFGLGKKADAIRVYNKEGKLVDIVAYNDTFPDAVGNGKTLALIDPNSDNTLAENWIASTLYGTPGE